MSMNALFKLQRFVNQESRRDSKFQYIRWGNGWDTAGRCQLSWERNFSGRLSALWVGRSRLWTWRRRRYNVCRQLDYYRWLEVFREVNFRQGFNLLLTVTSNEQSWQFCSKGVQRRRPERNIGDWIHPLILPFPPRLEIGPLNPPRKSGKWCKPVTTSQRAVMLCGWGVKAGMVCMCGWQLKLCDPLLSRTISERFRNEFMIKRYTNRRYFTLLWSKLPNGVLVKSQPKSNLVHYPKIWHLEATKFMILLQTQLIRYVNYWGGRYITWAPWLKYWGLGRH